MFNQLKKLSEQVEYEYSVSNYYKVSQLCSKSSKLNFTPHLLNYKACALYKYGLYQKALEFFNSLIKLSPNSSYAYFNRASTYDELKIFDSAIKDYNKALNYDLNDPDIYSNRAVTKFKANDVEGSLRDLNKAIKLNSNDSTFYYNRAIIFEKLQKKSMAIADFEKASNLGLELAKQKLKDS
jgi:tetratricopeptide (TPR) repeat protein